MLQFLQAWLWAFAAVASLPIILHLLSRQRLKKIQFSSLMLIARLEKSQMRRLRLRQLLLLILRTLTVLALVFAFTRPLIREQRAHVIGSTQTAAIVVMDRSASMSALGAAGRRSDAAHTQAHRVIQSFGPGDRLALVPDTGAATGVRFLYGAGEWSDMLDSATVTSGRADLGAAIDAALAILDTVAVGSKEVYVVTDGQNAAWQRPPVRDPGTVRVYMVSVADELQPNRTLSRLDFGPSLWVAHAPLEAEVTVKNSGPDVRDLPVSLFLDGRRLAQESVSIARGDSARVALRVPDLEAGWHSGKIEISADAWPADNTLYFALEAAASLPVLVVGDHTELVRPVTAALRPKPETRTPFAPEVVGTAALAAQIDPRFGLVALAGADALAPGAWDRLLRYVRGGGGLWVLLDPANDPVNYSTNFLQPVFGTDMKARVLGRSDGGFLVLERPAPHPLFSYLEHASAYPEIRFAGHAQLGQTSPTAVRQRFSDGSPAILEARLDRGRVILLSGYADPRQSDLIYHPLFVPLAQATATYLARRGAVGTQAFLQVGQRPPGLPTAEGTWQWVTPPGDTLALPGGPLQLPVLDVAGTYALLHDGAPYAYYAANIDPAELDLTPVADWKQAWGNHPYTLLSPGEDVGVAISQARVGLDLWLPAMLLVLLLLIAEMAVAWPRPGEVEASRSES
jgi:hypothetical protein